jgi:hypothetical protein
MMKIIKVLAFTAILFVLIIVGLSVAIGFYEKMEFESALQSDPTYQENKEIFDKAYGDLKDNTYEVPDPESKIKGMWKQFDAITGEPVGIEFFQEDKSSYLDLYNNEKSMNSYRIDWSVNPAELYYSVGDREQKFYIEFVSEEKIAMIEDFEELGEDALRFTITPKVLIKMSDEEVNEYQSQIQ